MTPKRVTGCGSSAIGSSGSSVPSRRFGTLVTPVVGDHLAVAPFGAVAPDRDHLHALRARFEAPDHVRINPKSAILMPPRCTSSGRHDSPYTLWLRQSEPPPLSPLGKGGIGGWFALPQPGKRFDPVPGSD